MSWTRRTITRDILFAVASALVVLVVALAFAAPFLARRHEEDVLGARLASEARLVAELARDDLRRLDAEALDELAKRIGSAAGFRVTFVAPDGLVLGDSDEERGSMDNQAGRPEIAAARTGGEGQAVRRATTVDRDLFYVAVAVRDEAGAPLGFARTALPLPSAEAFAGRLAGLIVGASVLAALAGFAAALVLGQVLARPIVTLTRQAELAPGPAAEAFDVSGPLEVERLAAALRRMAAAIRGEQRLAQAERDRLKALVDELGDAILIVDEDDRVSLANAAATRVLGAEAPVGRLLPEVVREHEVLEAVARARAGRETVAHVERSDPLRFVRAVARPLERGELLLVLQDLTALRRLETVRSDFVANVSHELRTPLASLKAMAETLEEGALRDPTVAADFIRRMHEEIDGLAQLVNELLTLTRIESGAERMALRRTSPGAILREAERRMAPLVSRAGLALHAEVADDLPDVLADPERIGQVLANVLHNAVKFSPPGGAIRLSAFRDGGGVAFAVSDEGSGIARDELERIFERFYKSDRARSGGGTGLGLAIAKHIVDAHGGDIRAESAGPGRGATFTFRIPVAR